MNHPTREEWMSYLYEELPSETHQNLNAHLLCCTACRTELNAWRETMGKLDTFTVPLKRPSPPAFAHYLKWGLAAMLLLGLGFALARVTAPAVSANAVRAELRQELRAEIEQTALAVGKSQQTLNEFIKAYQSGRMEDRTNIVAILRQMELQRVSDYADLRKDLETVAVTAENKLNFTEQQIGQLAGYTQPTDTSKRRQ